MIIGRARDIGDHAILHFGTLVSPFTNTAICELAYHRARCQPDIVAMPSTCRSCATTRYRAAPSAVPVATFHDLDQRLGARAHRLARIVSSSFSIALRAWRHPRGSLFKKELTLGAFSLRFRAAWDRPLQPGAAPGTCENPGRTTPCRISDPVPPSTYWPVMPMPRSHYCITATPARPPPAARRSPGIVAARQHQLEQVNDRRHDISCGVWSCPPIDDQRRIDGHERAGPMSSRLVDPRKDRTSRSLETAIGKVIARIE